MKSIMGKAVLIIFNDHAQSNGAETGVITCQVIGELTKSTKLHFEVTCWKCADGIPNSHNNEVYNILRSTILKMYVFGTGREIKRFK